MQRRFLTTAGLLVVPLLGLTMAHGSDLRGGSGGPDKAPKPPSLVNPLDKDKDCPDGQCGKHGTTVAFEDSPAEAAKKAKKEEKLVLVLHVSGIFEDPKLT